MLNSHMCCRRFISFHICQQQQFFYKRRSSTSRSAREAATFFPAAEEYVENCVNLAVSTEPAPPTAKRRVFPRQGYLITVIASSPGQSGRRLGRLRGEGIEDNGSSDLAWIVHWCVVFPLFFCYVILTTVISEVIFRNSRHEPLQYLT